jgi:hypothetical protein
MKTREGFISNSSTTSFCIMGTSFGKGELENEFGKETGECEDIYDELYERLRGTKLDLEIEPYCDQYYVGLPVSNMEETETLKQFRQRAYDELLACLGPNLIKDVQEVSFVVEGWRDG